MSDLQHYYLIETRLGLLAFKTRAEARDWILKNTSVALNAPVYEASGPEVSIGTVALDIKIEVPA